MHPCAAGCGINDRLDRNALGLSSQTSQKAPSANDPRSFSDRTAPRTAAASPHTTASSTAAALCAIELHTAHQDVAYSSSPTSSLYAVRSHCRPWNAQRRHGLLPRELRTAFA